MKAPEIIETEEKIMAKYSYDLDKDADGVSSVSAGVYVELNKKEALDEAVKAIIESSAPQWLKDLIKGSV